MTIEAKFYHYDPLNPALGYVVEISETGNVLLTSATDPANGADLLTPNDCLRVISQYVVAEQGDPKLYTFDVKLLATVRVVAADEPTARAQLRDALDCADANFGAWPDGSPILAEASIDGDADLIEVETRF
jgi:hypothetical protein